MAEQPPRLVKRHIYRVNNINMDDRIAHRVEQHERLHERE